MKGSQFLGRLTFLFLISGIQMLRAQELISIPSLKNYFRNPLGIPMKVSANLGELRPDHWHMGFDLRTNAQENFPVYAAAEGYIAHVAVRPNGFGRFIVINHPNGTSTLYAHLNDFNPALEAYVTAQQYKQESWSIELDFTKNQFPVSRGAFIAYSGNTGGSQGPHLHFEIFETATTKRLNPLFFNFSLEDHVAPSILQLAVYDRTRSIYSQEPRLFPVKNTDSGYIIPKPSVIKTGSGKISFAIRAFDRMNKGGSEDGIYAASLAMDDEPVLRFELDSIVYDERTYLNAHIDYRYNQRGGPYLQLLTTLPGNRSPVYKTISGDGLLELSDTLLHKIDIEVWDAFGNSSRLQFFIQYDEPSSTITNSVSGPVLIPNTEYKFEKTDFSFLIGKNSLYDTVPAYYYRSPSRSPFAVTASHQLSDPTYPLHGEATVRIKPDRTLPEEWKKKLVMQNSLGGKTVRKAAWNEGWLTATMSDFGSFQVFADLQPPQISTPSAFRKGIQDTMILDKGNYIIFSPSDDFGVIKNFRVELDSQWIRFVNDKSRSWIYKIDDRCPFGLHLISATATDLAGNSVTKTWWFRRVPYVPPPPKKKKTAVKKTGSKKKNKK